MDFLEGDIFYEASAIANEICDTVSRYHSIPIEKINHHTIKKYVEAVEGVEFIDYRFRKQLQQIILGSTSKVANSVFITTNAFLKPERKNFTLMHEIMHYYCDIPTAKEGQTFSDMFLEDGYLPEDYEKETRANIGASILLANDTALEYATHHFSSFDQVAQYFFMSKTALQKRLNEFLIFYKKCSPNYAHSLVTSYRYRNNKEILQYLKS
ncbi:ImmA/IrrE family metallo-endopeptidase [Enterococcus sp. BWR-S5]|uniref:ImmA/IrrE family metallo-endopeptidase n=1 Tax=Enterococcus sp. BWR-S5 TaxID=2787714 RepID=UPI0019219B92|nr:ImmA/IrrE family metallo-endopeptidase [Enterococcus sp. BWR-S5]MBL1225411.1 ImmA/IrrE family metallo-endopeptidase [Enterococcus sp. BWR-S5]